ncbi:hypothetical protein D9M72_390040 [compost metagenome]
MQYDFVIIFVWLDLVFDSNPAVAFELFREVDSGYCICVAKKHLARMLVSFQTLLYKLDFVRKHFFKPSFSNISSVGFSAINSVAKIFIISRHSFCYSSRRTASSEEMSYGFLSGTNLCKSAINIFVQVNTEGFILYRRNLLDDLISFKFDFVLVVSHNSDNTLQS